MLMNSVLLDALASAEAEAIAEEHHHEAEAAIAEADARAQEEAARIAAIIEFEDYEGELEVYIATMEESKEQAIADGFVEEEAAI